MNLRPPYSVLYFCSPPRHWQLTLKHERQRHGHYLYHRDDKVFIWPESVEAKIISPKKIDLLFTELPAKDILLFDRVRGVDGFVSIVGHVNRSGTNMLMGNTPYKEHPQFPDMSNIYQPVPGYPQAVVHTLGPERFKKPPREANIVWSEAVGLVAPVLHYLGLPLSGLGGDPGQTSLTTELQAL